MRRRRRLRRFAISCALGAVIGVLASVATARTGNGIYVYLARFACGGIGLILGFSLLVGLNLGRPLAVRMETPSAATPSRPFTGVCVLGFAVSVIVASAITGGLLSG